MYISASSWISGFIANQLPSSEDVSTEILHAIPNEDSYHTTTNEDCIRGSVCSVRPTEKMRTDIYSSSGIRTHDPSISAGVGVLCLGPCSNCDPHRFSATYFLLHSQVFLICGTPRTRSLIAVNNLLLISYTCIFRIQNILLYTSTDSFLCCGE